MVDVFPTCFAEGLFEKVGVESFTDRPDLYNIMYASEYADLSLYRGFCEGHRDVLVLAAGTGRVVVDLVHAGHFVYCVDNSEAMLGNFKKSLVGLPDVSKRVELYLHDMQNFIYQDGGKLDRIVIPFGSFNYLINIESRIKTLRSALKNLRKGGKIMLELNSVALYPELKDSCEGEKALGSVRMDGSKLTDLLECDHYSISRKTSYDYSTKVILQKRLFRYMTWYRELRIEKSARLTWKNIMIGPEEISMLLNHVGFEHVTIGGYYSEDKKWGLDSDNIVVIGVK